MKIASGIRETGLISQDFEHVAQLFAHLQRPSFHRALEFGKLGTPSMLGIALAILLSLIKEDAPFSDDARMHAMQYCFWLGLPDLGKRLIEERAAVASNYHREQFALAATAFATLRPLRLADWFSGPAALVHAALQAFGDSPAPILCCGATSALAMLFGSADLLYSLHLLDSATLSRRFYDVLPRTIAVVEPTVPVQSLVPVLQSYAIAGVTRIVAPLPVEALFDVDGFHCTRRAIPIPSGVALSLIDAAAIGVPLGTPALSAPSDDLQRYVLAIWDRNDG